MIDVEALSAPLADDAPCGPNLEYDLDFQGLETASRDKPDQEFGKGNVIAGQEADWQDVLQRATALCARTRDLRVAVLLTRALTRIEGLPGLADGLSLIARLLELHWDHLHPQPDPEEPGDQMMRMSVLMVLADPAALGRDLRKAAFMATRAGGTVTVRQLEVGLGFAEKGTGDDAPMPRPQIEGMLREAAAAGLTNGAKASLAALERIAEVLKQKVEVSQRADLRPLVARLRPIAAFFTEIVPEPVVQEAAVGDQAQAESAVGATAPVAIAPPGDIRNRDDVDRMLGKICEYLERNEPTNPAPLLLRRAQKLMSMNFVDILKDIAPEGVASISKIAGLPGEGK